jgi:hypothetical protein
LSRRLTRLLALALNLGPVVVTAQTAGRPCDAICLSSRAREALAAGSYNEYLSFATQIAERATDHPGALYAVARGLALIGNLDSAIVWLERLADIGASREVTEDSAFNALRGFAEFRAVRARLEANGATLSRGKVAFTVPDPDLLPEALAFDFSTGTWLVGSLAKRKLVRITRDGSATDLLAGPDMLRVLGIHVDSARSHFWFATYAPGTGAGAPGERPPSESRLFKCDLRTGRIVRNYAPRDSGGHVFNDLAIAANGDVFVTDTERGWLYRIHATVDSLEVFVRPDAEKFSGANGIALSADGSVLYVAFIEGIARVDLRTRRIERLHSTAATSTGGIDGLYWYRGDLLAVQNPPGLRRVLRYELAADGRSIRKAEVLERGDSLLGVPTTGAVVGTQFYFIANSQVDRLSNDNRLRPSSDSLAPRTVVRVIELQ